MVRTASFVLITSALAGCGAAADAQSGQKALVSLPEPNDDVDPHIIGAAVRDNPTRFRRCYEEARERNPSLSGLIEVRFVINTDGTVGQAVAAQTDLPSTVADCVVEAFYELRLPVQEEAVVAQYPMFFEPS